MSAHTQRLAAALADRYTIEREIGAGGMATVYLADDVKHRRKVAVKVLKPELSTMLGPDRFLREIEITAQLNHPHILPLLDSGKARGFLFYVMPYVIGESLRARLNRAQQLPVEESITIATEVADALDTAHEMGVIHRDVKPENILLARGHAQVADFGIARALSAAGDQYLTATGVAIGTPAYMSPEQASGEKNIDGRSDLFSLGCVCYEMLTGEQPFVGTTAQAVIAKRFVEIPPSVSDRRPVVPMSVSTAVATLLAHEVGDRFQSGAEFIAALKSDGGARRTTEDRSIVVLPFLDMSPDGDSEYFSDGLTEEIIADLSQIDALRVISRTSAMQLKGVEKDARTIGRELSVRYVLEGGVRKVGNNLRITSQLIDARRDQNIWAKKFVGSLDDVFGIQEQVSRQITEALALELTPREERHIARRPVSDLREVEYYWRGRQDISRLAPEPIARAIERFNDGLATVGESALMLSGLGQAYLLYSALTPGGRSPGSELLQKAERTAKRALELDPNSSKAHFTLAWICNDTFRFAEALAYMDRALELDPNDSEALTIAAMLYAWGGRTVDAQTCMARLTEIDPLNLNVFLPMAKIWAGQFDHAVDAAKRVYDHDRDSATARTVLAWSLVYSGRRDEARELLAQDEPSDELFAMLGIMLRGALTGNSSAVLDAATNELQAHVATDAQIPWLLAGCLAAIDEQDRAAETFAHAVRGGFANYPFLVEQDVLLRTLVGNRRFDALVSEVKSRWEALPGSDRSAYSNANASPHP